MMGFERAIVRSGKREQGLAWIANNSWTHTPCPVQDTVKKE